MRALPPRPLPRVPLIGLVPIAAWFIVRPLLDPVPPLPALYTSVGFSIFAFLATIHLIPALGPSFVKAGLKGGDLLKPYCHEIPMSLAVYLSSLLSLILATMLGFLDDVFDIRWRHKLPIPIVASIPLLMVYYAERGNTHVVVPLPLRFLLGTLVNLASIFSQGSMALKSRKH
ncbi:hypothetical protein C0992_007091 [Termitomyces sp. T32_za158]|nr:hypothetical protein C0992_007091 [Termitomyces sp. T32_za158]